jgi:hypothetical protein
MIDGIRRIYRIHYAFAPRAMFNAGIRDAAREALMALRNEKAKTLQGSKFRHFPSKALRSSEVHVHSNVHDDPTGRLKEQVRLTKALVEAIQEIEDLHNSYEEQEQLIKDHDDLIVELLDEVEDSDDNSDNDSDDEGNNEGNGDGNDGGDDNIEEVPEQEPEQEPILEVAEDPYILPQAMLPPPVFPQPNLYQKLMQDFTENPPMRLES